MAETHEIIELERKPSDEEIRQMVSQYFDEQSATYDQLSEQTKKRKLYLQTIDTLIVEEFKAKAKLEKVLSIGCGTGSREVRIKNLVGRPMNIFGVDPSLEMCKAAEQRGLQMVQSFWGESQINEEKFDAILYLHAFGSTPSERARKIEMKKVFDSLNKGGVFFIDVLNLADQNEWGPEVLDRFSKFHLDKRGYEKGDLFYRRIGYQETSYFHYFSREELQVLLRGAGFNQINESFIGYGAHYGQFVSPSEGAILARCVK